MRAAVVLVLLGGCVREPAEAVCPALDAGDLVITEIRGEQSPDDALGPWIEVYNASGAPVDLLGIRAAFADSDKNVFSFLVRRSIPVVAGGYAVLGRVGDAAPPPHIDYGFAQDFIDVSWPDSRTGLSITSCGTALDRIVYDNLPRVGTYALGGPPDANANDLPARWCTDPTSSGTPRAPNACP